MSIVSAERNFCKGLAALDDQNYVEASIYFRRAMDVEHQRRVPQPDMRYLSYYGLCRAKAHFKIEEGLHACKRAALSRKRDPEMYLNLGRVYLVARRRREAYEAFRNGLAIEPFHTELNLEAGRLAKWFPRNARTGRRAGFFGKVRSALSRPAQSSH